MTRVAINGMGRIGRAAFRVLLDDLTFEIVAVNDLTDAKNLAYLISYDTVHGRLHRDVVLRDDALLVDGRRIAILSETDPADLPWRELQIELVFECTGVLTTEEQLSRHLDAGARYVILSAPSPSANLPTVVHAVNSPTGHPPLISCASCTTNCIAPVLEILDRRLGIERAIMTTIHAYTGGQRLTDGAHGRARRGRAGAANLVPSTTWATRATGQVLPALVGRFGGIAVRAPITDGSLADIVVVASRPTSATEINDIFRQEAEHHRYRGIVAVSGDPLVSSDIIGDTHAAVIDEELTQVVDGVLVKVMAWYDNEWGFTHQMVREAHRLLERT